MSSEARCQPGFCGKSSLGCNPRIRGVVPTMQSSSLELKSEGINHTSDEIRQLLKAWNDRLTLSGAELVKRYIEGHLVIGIRMRTTCSGQPMGDYFIQFSRLPFHQGVAPHTEVSRNDNQQLMFVDNVQLVKDKQGMVLNVANGVIRL